MTALIGLQCHLCKARFPAEATLRLRQVPRPARAGVRLRRDHVDARGDRAGDRRTSGATASCCRLPASPRTGFNSGFTPLVRCDRLAKRLGVSELYIKDDSVNHPTLSYKDRVVSVAATRAVELGIQGAGLRVDRQPGEQRRGARRASRPRVLRLHPGQPRSGEAARLGDFRPDDPRDRRQLRRRESVVHAGGGSVRVGIREHQPPLVLRGRREDDGLRDRRAAGLALPGHIWCHRWRAARCCRASCAGSAS